MKKWTTAGGHEIYKVLGGRSNSYLVSHGNRHILVDTGRKNRYGSLKRRLEKLGVREGTLSALVLTHTHFDHAENASHIKNDYHTKIIVHESESGFLAAGDNPVIRGTNCFTKFMTDRFAARIMPRLRYDPCESDVRVGDRYDLSDKGFNAFILHTPGHSEGSMSVVVDDEIAIVGDSMFGVFPGSVYPPFADDPEIMVRSWKRLLDTGCRLFLPGHGTGDRQELLRRQYDRCKEKLKN